MGEFSNPLKLTGDNGAVWKFQTVIILKGFYEIIDGSKEKPTSVGDELTKWLKDDAKAQELLGTRMEQGPLTHILSCDSAKDVELVENCVRKRINSYGEDTKGYRAFIPEKKKVEIHRDVILLPEKKNVTQELEEVFLVPKDEPIVESETEQRHEGENNDSLTENSDSTSEIEASDKDYKDAGSGDSEVNEEIGNRRYNLRRERRPNPTYDDFEMNIDRVLVSGDNEDEPDSNDDAIASSESENWTKAMEEEISALNENDTWSIVKENVLKYKNACN
ncbi:hypothetical protein HHI36_007961 [Cryptolaemus montrouzieri]|uniref:Uncharacterized protein n=1 Tax=Cryptolaemus montrouzieri TaxID=559131 RepID=A0ABD2MRD7_9CUCU